MDIFWLFLPFIYIYSRYKRFVNVSRKTNYRIRGNGLDWAKLLALVRQNLGHFRFTQWLRVKISLAALAREFHPKFIGIHDIKHSDL